MGDELSQRIRKIRASGRRFYLKITDLFEQARFDYQVVCLMKAHIRRPLRIQTGSLTPYAKLVN